MWSSNTFYVKRNFQRTCAKLVMLYTLSVVNKVTTFNMITILEIKSSGNWVIR